MVVDSKMRLKPRKIAQLCLLCAVLIVVYFMAFGIDMTIDCFKFCLGGTCFNSRLAILVYRDNVSPKNMEFLQNYRPNAGTFQYLTGSYDPESCPMEQHFSQLTAIPPKNNCAIVGNGGILLHSNCGVDIDSHDYVIRINLAPLRGYRNDVGVKTDLTLLNFETLVYLHGNLTRKTIDDELHQMYVNRAWFLNDSVIWYGKSMGPRETRKRLQESVQILKTTYQLPIRIAYSWRPLHPEKFFSGMDRLATSGFNAYYVARSLCKHVTLYGFYPSTKDDRGYHMPHHYYEDVPYEYNNPVHNLLWEFKTLKEHAAQGKLRLVTEKCAERSSTNDKPSRRRQENIPELKKPLGDLFWLGIKDA